MNKELKNWKETISEKLNEYSHPSGLEDDGELANVSMEFFKVYHDRLDPGFAKNAEGWGALLAFQKGWKACKDFYRVDNV